MASLLAGILQQDTLAHLTDNETINCEIVEKILVELVEKLSEAQVKLLFPAIFDYFRIAWNRQRRGIYRKLRKLKGKSGKY